MEKLGCAGSQQVADAHLPFSCGAELPGASLPPLAVTLSRRASMCHFTVGDASTAAGAEPAVGKDGLTGTLVISTSCSECAWSLPSQIKNAKWERITHVPQVGSERPLPALALVVRVRPKAPWLLAEAGVQVAAGLAASFLSVYQLGRLAHSRLPIQSGPSAKKNSEDQEGKGNDWRQLSPALELRFLLRIKTKISNLGWEVQPDGPHIAGRPGAFLNLSSLSNSEPTFGGPARFLKGGHKCAHPADQLTPQS
ncbi:hypothetical protein P7K49_025034 [Saguinus oedipus]|uniref:Uncharacterized protein n=1 Tax=Saguinus oedipus TaxID=9490 RepID=A0ABQ9UGY4_SAGOE|nr:hypothetical protein P7K49_025034 [Saguinus oedipus]